MTKVFPDNTLEKIAREAGADVRVFWEMHGPKNTDVAWMHMIMINNVPMIVQTFKSGGWSVYVHTGIPDTDQTIADVFNLCGVQLPVKA